MKLRLGVMACIGLALVLGGWAAKSAAPSFDKLTPEDRALLHFEAGQWLFATTNNGKSTPMKICFDDELSERYIDMVRDSGLTSCDKAVINKTADGFSLHSVCKGVNNHLATTDLVRKVTDKSHFIQNTKVVWTKRDSGKLMATDISVTKASRLGGCPLSSQPGDIVFDDGYKMNMYELMYVPKETD